MNRHPCVRSSLAALVLAVSLPAAPITAAEVSRFLPAGTEIVAVVNVRQLLDAPLAKKHALEQARTALKDNADLQKILSATGFDPLRDVTTLTLAAPGGDLQDGVLLIVSGTFHVDRIHAAADEIIKAEPATLKVHTHGRLRIYESKGKDGSGPGFAALADRTTLLVSPTQAPILAAIEAASQPRPAPKKELLALIEKADGQQSVWFAALATKEMKELLRSNAQTVNVADKITSFTGTVTLSDAARAIVHIHATDLRAAGEVQRLMEALKGFVQFAALSNKEYGPLFSDILDALKVSSQRNTVTIGGMVTSDVIDKGLRKGRP